MTTYSLSGHLLNGQTWLVDSSVVVTPPSPTLTINTITAPAANATYTVHGTYANFTMAGLQYSTSSTNGTDGNWSNASPSIGSGTYAFTANGLPAGTYTLWVRRTDFTSLFASSNSFTVTSAGSTSSLSQPTTVIDAKRIFSRDVTTGNPTGFTTTYNKGWSSVPFTLTSGTAASLYIALYDADSSGATTTVATGTLIQSAVPVASVLIGQQTINLNIPAGPKFYYVDFALNAQMTNALRITSPVGVGHVTAAAGQSIAFGMFSPYFYFGSAYLDQMTTFLPQNVVYAPLCITGGNNNSGWTDHNATSYLGGLDPGQDIWLNPGPTSDPPVGSPAGTKGSPYSTTFAPEYLSRMYNKLGVVTALIGFALNGWGIETWDPVRGTQSNGGFGGNLFDHYGSFKAAMNHAGNKIDTFIWCHGDADPGLLIEEYAARLDQIIQAITALAQKPFNTIASLSFRQNGGVNSKWRDWIDINIAQQRALAKYSNSIWFDQANNSNSFELHPTWACRVYGARAYYRAVLTQMGIGSRGPSITSATRASGSNLINLTIQHDAGTALVPHLLDDQTNTSSQANLHIFASNTATPVDLAQMFRVFPTGANPTVNGDGTFPGEVAMDATTPVAITSATNVQIKLASTPANNVALDVWYGWNAVTNERVGLIMDNTDDGDGIPHGRMLRQSTSAFYVAPPTAVAASIAITKVNGASSSFKAAKNGLIVVAGTWTGLPPTGVDLSLDGTTYVTGADFLSDHGGTWRATVTSPNTNGTYTLTAKLHGTSTVSSGVSVVIANTDFPLSGATFDMDLRQLNNIFKNTARTQVAADGDFVFGVIDSSGSGNHLTALNSGPRLEYNNANGTPGLMFSGVSTDGRYSGPTPVFMGLQTISGSTLPASLRNASFTILVVARPSWIGPNYWPVFNAEQNWSAGANNPQSLAVYISGGDAYAQRFNGTNSTGFSGPNTTEGAITPAVSHTFATTKYVARFDVTTGTLKMKGASGYAEQTSVAPGDFATGAAWDYCGIGFEACGHVGGGNNAGLCFDGTIHRVVVIPNHYASDSETDAILAYADAVYGP